MPHGSLHRLINSEFSFERPSHEHTPTHSLLGRTLTTGPRVLDWLDTRAIPILAPLRGLDGGEARAAIAARLDSSQAVIAEVATRYLLSADSAVAADIRKGRVDLVIVRHRKGKIAKESQIGRAATTLIEIKRGKASLAELKKDLVRLAQIVATLVSGTRAFLIVGCESGKVSTAFVRKGVLVKGEQSIEGGVYFVRRVWRASQAKTSIKVSHSVVLVEVEARTS
jgi:hypothetical protein